MQTTKNSWSVASSPTRIPVRSRRLRAEDHPINEVQSVIGCQPSTGYWRRGIGKTSVALAIFHSSELDDTFPPTRRFFVPCQLVTTASTFLSTIASSLGVKFSQGDAMALVMEKLKSESAPLMLLLDNGESFWFDHEIQPHARTILRHICSIRTITLLLTIRGTEHPNVTVWDPLPLLGPLSLSHARQAFLAIATSVEPDASLDRLLTMVDNVPLAVSLLARRCQIAGESSEVLCDRWEKEHTELLKLGGRERDDNIDISIKLSLESPLMRSNHNTLRLLSIVSYLPSGISDKACGSISLSDEESSAAEFLLRRLSLTYSPTLGWITTLEPIRAYIRRHFSPLADDLSAVDNWHINLANTHGNYEPGDAEFSAASAKLTENSANITFILRTHIQQYKGLTGISEAVLAFSRFLCWTRPNGDLLEKLLSAGINVLDHSAKGQCLQRLGNMLQRQSQWEEAQLKLEEARSEFIIIGNRIGAAQCLQSLGNIMRMRNRHEEAQLKLEEARSEFIIIGSRLGAAQCLRSLGDILKMQHQYQEAQLKVQEARSEFIVMGNRLGAAHCLPILGDMLGMQHRYEEAQLKLEEARSEFIIIGDQLGAAHCLQSLGEILRMQHQYEEAQLKLEEARSELIIIGNRLGAALCLRSLGDILRMRGQPEAARLKLEEARSEFITIGSRLGAAQCLRSLGDILQMRHEHAEAQLKLEEARSEFIIIGDQLGAAQCLRSLIDILQTQGQYGEAQLKVEEAWSGFIIIGDQLGAAQCLKSLGNILQMQDQNEEAQLKLGEARSEFIIIGNRLGAAQCLRCLGDILRVQGQYEEARLKLEEARSEFTAIGDRLGAAQCLGSLSDILQMQDQYEEAKLKLEEARSEFIMIGNQHGAALCLQRLGSILQMQNQHEEARLKLEKVWSEFTRLGLQRDADRCRKRLDDIAQVRT